jgi:hypothetical protein
MYAMNIVIHLLRIFFNISLKTKMQGGMELFNVKSKAQYFKKPWCVAMKTPFKSKITWK